MQLVFLTATAFWPRLILLDEITSVLDSVARSYFLKKLKAHTDAGGTVILATNIISEAQAHLDQVILLQDKRVMFNSSLADLRRQFTKVRRTPETSHEIFDSPNCVELTLEEDGVLEYLIPANLAAELPTELIATGKPTVSDIFIFMSRAR